MEKMKLAKIAKGIEKRNGVDTSGFAFLEYIMYYSEKGVVFKTCEHNTKGETHVVGNNAFCPEYIVTDSNKTQLKMIKKFYDCRWLDYWGGAEDIYHTNEIIFIDLELAFLDKFPDFVRERYEAIYYPLYGFFVDRKKAIESNFGNDRKMTNTKIPDNLKDLLSIWYDKNDTQNLIDIYQANKEIFSEKTTKKQVSCFAYTLNACGWLTTFEKDTFNPTEIAKIFLELAGLKFLPAYKEDFNFLGSEPLFDVKYTRKVNLSKRE